MKGLISIKAFMMLAISSSLLTACSYDKNHTTTTTTTPHSDTFVGGNQELAKHVKDAISKKWFSKEYDQVQVSAKDGIVTLQGPVKTWKEKEDIDREVRNLDGVMGLDSKISVQEDASRAKEHNLFPQDSYATPIDDQLNKKIRDNVSKGWIWDSYKSVALATDKGVVTLEGSVDSIESQQKLMQGIQKIPGVKMVKSNLRIER